MMGNTVKRLAIVWGVLLLIVFLPSRGVYGQTTFGSVVGLVTDSSGAAVPGAKVTLTSLDTNQIHTINSGDSGTFSFVSINPGTYRIDVDLTGFKHFSLTGIQVQVGSTARADAAMEVGNVSESVEVTSAAPLIQTDTANLGGVIEGRTIQDIPLNGRNVNNLLTLVPGVIAQGSTGGNFSTNLIAYGNYQIGGGFGNQSLFFIDGVGANIPANNATAVIPSQDTVREFRVSTSNVSAEFGGFAGGVVNISTKAGSNSFHGSAYEYHRNRVLNANDFFSNRAGRGRPALVQNQFGGTLGGPIKKNRTFFFAGYERQPVASGNLSTTTVPTAAMLRGDFRGAGIPAIYDPTTNTQFQCNGQINVICPSRIDPAVAALLKQDYPADATNPNAIANNYITTTRTRYRNEQINARVDQNFGTRNSLFVKYAKFKVESLTTNPYPGVQAFEPPAPGGISDHVAMIGDTFTLNPTTIIDGRVSYLRVYQYTYPRGLGTDISGISPGLKAMQTALGQQLPTAFSFAGTGIAGSTGPGQLYWHTNVYAAAGSVTKILGRHTLKAGGIFRSVQWIADPDSGGNVFAFEARPTSLYNPTTKAYSGGYSVASGLLGVPITTSAQAIGGSRAFFHNYGIFLTDSFQTTRRLTLDLGVRWEQPGSYSEANNWNTVILPDAASPLGVINNTTLGTQQTLRGKLALVGSSDYPSRREENLHWLLFSPRVGFAYRLTDKMVVRSGYGISYLPSTLSQDGPNSSSVNTAQTSISNSYNANGNGYSQISTSVSNPFPNGVLTPGRGDPSRLTALYGQNIQSRIPNQPYSYVQQWNLAFEQELGSTASFSIAYGGAKGTHLQAQGANTWSASNINQIPDQYLALGSDLETLVPNPFYGKIASGLLAQPTVFKGLLLKPFPQYNYVTAAGSRNSSSSYNSMQTSLKKRFSHGGLVSVAYTWAKLMSNTDSVTQFLEGGSTYQGTVQNNNNLSGEWSLSSSDYPHTATIGYGVDLPFGKNQMWMSNVHGPVGMIVSGWRANGLSTFRVGTPLGILAAPNEVAKYFGGGGYYQNNIGQGTIRPNVVQGCNKIPNSDSHARVDGTWFNTTCFTAPAAFGFGNESRTDNQIRRHGVNNWDFSLLKATPVRENLSVSFTAEFFNIFNRVQFQAPSTAAYDGGGYGKVTAQANNPRQIQFGVRITY
jgi:outer membrane receptor protein involved in Fe transport